MFAKIFASSLLISALCLQVTAHAAISPVLGLNRSPIRSDVQRPSNGQPCGNVGNIASKISKSTAVKADANGKINVKVTSFNGGKDGSRLVTAKVDATGTGVESNFVAMKVTINGNPNPAQAGSDNIEAVLPNGINCKNNQCLIQFQTSAGFGNCVVAQQQPGKGKGNVVDSANSSAGQGNITGGGKKSGGGKNSKNEVKSNVTNGNNNSTVGANPATTSTAASNVVNRDLAGTTGRVSGRHMARLLADLKNRGEGAGEIAK